MSSNIENSTCCNTEIENAIVSDDCNEDQTIPDDTKGCCDSECCCLCCAHLYTNNNTSQLPYLLTPLIPREKTSFYTSIYKFLINTVVWHPPKNN